MEHVEILQSLSAERKSHLTETSNREGLLHLSLYAGTMATTGALIALKVPCWGLINPIHGILICFLFTLSHECSHQTAFRSRWINEVVGHFCAVPILLPFILLRYFHLAHHEHTNDPDHDPELVSGGKPDRWGAYLIYLSGWVYWWTGATTLWTNAFGNPEAPYLSKRLRPRLRREARILLGIKACLAMSLLLTPVL